MNLYIHVPFCVRKCNYCAFYSACPDVIDWDGYVGEIFQQLNEFQIDSYKIDTIFFGGGTPSLMPAKYAEKIIKKLRLMPDAEWTLEANPKTINVNGLKDWKNLGLNRLSIGIQSFNDDDLKFLGRVHTVQDSMELLTGANDLGLRVSGDFIYGLPYQTVDDVRHLCAAINESGLKHASLYELTIEKGTPFQNLPPVSEQLAAEMYQAIRDALKLQRYEVSNYGELCRHNMNIWHGSEYIGVGESAAGRIIENGVWHETKIAGGRIVKSKLTPRQRAVEVLMTGLRTMRGVQIANLPVDVISWDFVRQNPGHFTREEGLLRMTDSGILLLDCLLEGLII